MMKTLVIQVRTGTMMNMDTNIAVKLAQAALDKGHLHVPTVGGDDS